MLKKTEQSVEDATQEPLTPKGQAIFEWVFPIHIQYLASSFNTLSMIEQKTLVRLLKKLKSAWKKN